MTVHAERIDGGGKTMCGTGNNPFRVGAAPRVSGDTDVVDCQRCVVALDRLGIDETDRDVKQRIKRLAYTRALYALRDLHRDEFDDLLEIEKASAMIEERIREPRGARIGGTP